LFAVIPYTTFPTIALGPIELRTFGLMVGLGVLVGAWIAARYIEQHTPFTRDDVYRLATKLVVAGVIGARITWDLTHTSEINSPLDLIAVWKGGLQFSGGFIGAVIVGFPTFRRWGRALRWINLDGYAYGLTIGLAIGRIGCISVGEHFGSHSSWLLAVRYDGGSVREGSLGANPLFVGSEFHNTAIYELLWMLVLFGILSLLIRRKPAPGMLMGVFCVYYGVARGLSDFLRVNDKTVAGLTGAQWMCIALIPTGIWILTRVRAATASDLAQIAADGDDPAPGSGDTSPQTSAAGGSAAEDR
jgi:phosphatidylglycerol:prolipoprotein diacylglycerol transferase